MDNIHFFFFLLFLTFLSTTNATFTTKNVFLRLYNRDGSYIDKNIRNTDELLSYIQKDNNLVIYITGYTSNIDSDNVKLIINAYLNNTQDNILALDYRDITQHLYPISVLAINELGTIVANALNTLIDNDVNEKKIHLIGYSLGAHLAGKIGRKTKFKIPRITALDPAGPLFYAFSSRLNSFDADFVDVIHTDSYILGLPKQLGHVDFYPNNGRRPQPGCPLISTLFFNTCSHSRAIEFYAESITDNNAFIGKCRNDCNDLFISMGYATPRNAKGNYDLVTNAHSPYGRGYEGVNDE